VTVNAGSTNPARVYPVSGGNVSRAVLPVTTVINVDSTAFYDTGGTPLASSLTGTTVSVRSVISDPFGSYDITSASIIITDPTGTVQVNGAAMTELVTAATPSTKTYEYAYPIPAAGPTGNWTFQVTAQEGAEGTISDYGVAALSVTLPMPNIMMLKSVSVISDPVNTSAPYRSIPGAVMQYAVSASNQGSGTTDADSVKLEDPIPPDTELFVGDLGTPGSGPVAFSALTSGLTYTFISLSDNTDSIEFSNTTTGPPYVYGYIPNPVGGYDPDVRSIRINLGGTFAATGSAPYPSFTLQFRVRVK
jgi:hypothetical protein